MRGRKPQPKAGGIVATDAGFPPPPKGMSVAAKKEWDRVGEQMGDQLINRLDEAILEAYCETRVRVRKLYAAIAKLKSITSRTKTGGQMPSLLISGVAKQEAHLAKLAAELGMTPVGRTRVAATEAAATKEESIEDMLQRRPKMRIAR